jgi:drug/metabolite transporter (DMT)-like permease
VRLAYLAWIAVCLIWGTTYLGIRIALETIPPALVGAIRYVLAGLILATILRLRGERLPPRSSWGGLVLVGGLLIAVGNGGVIWAEQWVPSSFAALLVAAAPFWMAGIEALLPGGERMTMRVSSGLLVGFAGIVLLVWPDLTAGGTIGRQFALGVVALQTACLGWALGSAYSRRHAREDNALGAAALQMVFGGLIMTVAATALGEWRMLTFTPRTLAAELYLLLVGSLLGYPAYVFALKHLPVSTVSLYAYVNPVIAVVLGTLLLDEPFGWRVIVAAALVFLGSAVVRWSGSLRGNKLELRTPRSVPSSVSRTSSDPRAPR